MAQQDWVQCSLRSCDCLVPPGAGFCDSIDSSATCKGNKACGGKRHFPGWDQQQGGGGGAGGDEKSRMLIPDNNNNNNNSTAPTQQQQPSNVNPESYGLPPTSQNQHQQQQPQQQEQQQQYQQQQQQQQQYQGQQQQQYPPASVQPQQNASYQPNQHQQPAFQQPQQGQFQGQKCARPECDKKAFLPGPNQFCCHGCKELPSYGACQRCPPVSGSPQSQPQQQQQQPPSPFAPGQLKPNAGGLAPGQQPARCKNHSCPCDSWDGNPGSSCCRSCKPGNVCAQAFHKFKGAAGGGAGNSKPPAQSFGNNQPSHHQGGGGGGGNFGPSQSGSFNPGFSNSSSAATGIEPLPQGVAPCANQSAGCPCSSFNGQFGEFCCKTCGQGYVCQAQHHIYTPPVCKNCHADYADPKNGKKLCRACFSNSSSFGPSTKPGGSGITKPVGLSNAKPMCVSCDDHYARPGSKWCSVCSYKHDTASDSKNQTKVPCKGYKGGCTKKILASKMNGYCQACEKKYNIY